jgi:hypothetical protein
MDKMYENGDAELALLGKLFPMVIFVTLTIWILRAMGLPFLEGEFRELYLILFERLSWFSLFPCLITGVASFNGKKARKLDTLWTIKTIFTGICVLIIIVLVLASITSTFRIGRLL